MDVEPSSSRQAVAPGKFSNGRYLWPGQKVPLEDGSYDIPLKEGFREAPQPKIPSSVVRIISCHKLSMKTHCRPEAIPYKSELTPFI